jgi:PKD repeat protein
MSNYLYIIGYDTKLLEFDLNSNSVTNQFNIPVRGYQITLVGNILNIVGNIPSQSNCYLYRFNLSDNSTLDNTLIRSSGNFYWSRGFVKNNRYLYIPYYNPNVIDVIDLQNLKIETISLSKSVWNLVYDPFNDKIFIDGKSSKISRLDNNKFDFTTSKTDVTCGLNNGSVKLTIPNDGKTYTYLWSNGAKTKDVSNLSAGDYTVTVTQTGGCSVRKTITIAQTNVAFTASVSPNNGNICPNTTLSLVSSVGKSYVWYKDNVVISGATNQTYSASVAGNYKVVVTNSNNCIATSSVVPVTIIPNPEANFTSTVSGNTATFTNTSTNGNQYLWNFGDGSTDTQFSPIKTYANKNNTYSVNLKTTNQCGASNEVSKKIVISCISTATLSGSQSISAGQSATLSVALTGTSPWAIVINGVTYNNITTSPYTFSVTPNATTTYTLSSVSNSCGKHYKWLGCCNGKCLYASYGNKRRALWSRYSKPYRFWLHWNLQLVFGKYRRKRFGINRYFYHTSTLSNK